METISPFFLIKVIKDIQPTIPPWDFVDYLYSFPEISLATAGKMMQLNKFIGYVNILWGNSTSFLTQVVHATYNQWKRPPSGEHDLEERGGSFRCFELSGKTSLFPLTV